jgi:PAS domain S-box-containing protein
MQDRDLYDLLEHTSDAAFAVTDSGDICSWNASAEALFGFHSDEAIGKTCSSCSRVGIYSALSLVLKTVASETARPTMRRFQISIWRSVPAMAAESG